MNEDKNSTSVHFINGDNQLRCEFMPHQSRQAVVDEIDSRHNDLQNEMQINRQQQQDQMNEKNYHQQINQQSNSGSTNNSPNETKKFAIAHQPLLQHTNDEISSSFCTINTNGKLDESSVINNNNRNVDSNNYERYDFAIPLPFSDYKAPPRRSELSSFMHNPLSKTLDTFSKLSSLLKEDLDERSDDNLFFRQSNHHQQQQQQNNFNVQETQQKFPPPSLPAIEAKNPKSRLAPITELEYDSELKFKSKLYLLERIFLGGLESDSLRRRLWPILLGVMEDDNEDNWKPLTDLYNLFMQQWQSITLDQEARFTSFREKKSMAERDVIRCDRCHPYFQKQENIDILRDILMCYIMYDFDTGYVQGMTDLAAPLLYVFEGDPVKTFWCFVGVLNLTKKNFNEMEQTTVKNLLIKLFKLVNLTDPCFAEFLAENESDNCYFAFRWLICLFKREFVKADNNYDQLLVVWDTLWSLSLYEKVRQEEAQEEFRRQLNILKDEVNNTSVNNETTSDLTSSLSNKDLDTTLGTSPPYIVREFDNKGGDFDDSTANANNVSPVANRTSDSEQEDTNQLTNFELFFLSISLAIIRQERDLIFTQKLDAAGILKHFNTLTLNNYLNETLKHATLIWYWLKYDGGEQQLYQENVGNKDNDFFKSNGGFDLLDD